MAEPVLNFVGRRFGRLLVTGVAPRGGNHGQVWICKCDCGGTARRRTDNLKGVAFNGCDACMLERRGMSRARHGEFQKCGDKEKRTRLWRTWASMRERCTNPKIIGWKHYGGKGITVCAEWNDFGVFRAWAMVNGYTDKMTIERRDSYGNYEPQNCEWITASETARRSATQRGMRRRLERSLISDDQRPHFPIEMFWGHA